LEFRGQCSEISEESDFTLYAEWFATNAEWFATNAEWFVTNAEWFAMNAIALILKTTD